MDLAGGLDSRSGIAEHAGDADPVQPDPGGSERGEAVVASTPRWSAASRASLISVRAVSRSPSTAAV